MNSYPYSIPANPKTMNKEDVVTWFRMLSGSQRIETLCALLDCCVPFEVRFIGSVIEDLGRRDFHELRDVENRANNFMQANKSPDTNKLALYNSLAAEPGQPVPTNPGSVPQYGPSSNANSSLSHQSVQLNSAFAISQDARNNRPSPTHNKDGKARVWSYENQQMLSAQSHPKSSNSQAISPLVNGSCLPTKGATNTSSNCSAEDENDEDLRNSPPTGGGGDLLVLSVDRTRQRMILYLALLTCTNREASSSFYALMSQVEQTVGAPGWLEGLEEIVLEEVALLYTLGAHHPAFSFEQRIMLSEILTQVRSQLFKQRVTRSYPNYYMPYDSKYGQPGYYLQYVNVPAQQVSQVQPQLATAGTQAPPQQQQQQQLSQAVVSGGNVVSVPQGVDTSRLPPQTQVPQIAYYQPLSYPTVYMTPQHPQHQHHLHLVGNPVPARNIVPVTPLQSPRTAGMPIPNNAGPAQTDKYRPVKPENSQNLIDDDDGMGLPPLNEVNITIPVGSARRISCFNCGESTHSGNACPLQRMEEITQSLYRVKFTGNDTNPSPPADSSSS